MTIARWGILSTATIARKNWRAIALAENATVTAVASRDQAKAARFIVDCNTQFPMGTIVDAVHGYDALLERDDIDAVYIPLPTGVRKEWILKAMRAGKHVLSEKPVAIHMADMKEIADEATKCNVQFMDGVMFGHSIRYEALIKFLLTENGVGTIRRITSNFSFLAGSDFQANNIRGDASQEPLGCLGDLGWYCARMILAAKNWVLPSAVIGRTLHAYAASDGTHVPSEFSADIFFADGTSASFFCSFLVENQEWIHISGDKGHLYVDDFVLPFLGKQTSYVSNLPVYTLDGCDFRMASHQRIHSFDEASHGAATAQEVNMFRNFSSLIVQKAIDHNWLKRAVCTQRVISALKESSDAGSKLLELQ